VYIAGVTLLFQYLNTQGSDNFVVRSGSVVRTGRSNSSSFPASFKPMARVSAYIMSLLVMASIVAGAAVSGHQGHLPHAARIPPFVRLLQTKLYFPLPLLRLRGGHDLETVVADHLRTLGMWHHQTAFEREGIHARNLPDLTADDLAELVCVRVCMRRERESGCFIVYNIAMHMCMFVYTCLVVCCTSFTPLLGLLHVHDAPHDLSIANWTITHVCTRKHQGLSIQETTAFLHHTANQHEEQSAKPGNVDEEVVETLAALGLLRYQAVFEREEIRARNLPDLTTEDLAELVGVLGGG